MIYSKRLQDYIPVQIETKCYDLKDLGQFTQYYVKDGRITVGHVDLRETVNGVNVEYIENYHPDLYSKFGTIADQLEVEHCLKRGLDTFEITSKAVKNSRALHYLRGKRFIPEAINEKVREIIAKTPKGKNFNTTYLNQVDMYMPKDLIQKYLNIIKKNPLILKKLF